MSETKIILDACCGSRMCWFDKENPLTLFADIRDEEHIFGHTTGRHGKTMWMCFMKPPID